MSQHQNTYSTLNIYKPFSGNKCFSPNTSPWKTKKNPPPQKKPQNKTLAQQKEGSELAGFFLVASRVCFSRLGFRKVIPWHWNRFIVPLDRGPHGILAGAFARSTTGGFLGCSLEPSTGHAILGVLKPGAKTSDGVGAVKEKLRKRGALGGRQTWR